ncbi:MAG: DUF1292 domain-containing protein [Oscillospiraceae bacterium]|nr:DUF1292 domain-containing protein [Oscillospiraceae bacterium]
MADEIFEDDIYTLTDEEGNENKFELQGSLELDGVTYLALMPIDETDDEFVILKVTTDDDGEEILITIDDDDEFDRIADIFQDELFGNIDYDEDEEPDEEEI